MQLPEVSFPSRSSSGRRLRRGACFLVLALLTGCATGDVSMLATISGGERIRVPIGNTGVLPTVVDGVKSEGPVPRPDAQKKLVYYFNLSDRRARPLKSVRVEDVSDAEPILLLDDTHATWTDGRWQGNSAPLGPEDRAMNWMTTITNTLRVFRFTVTFADGKTLTLYQGAMYPNFVKTMVRGGWGMNY
jgi:hypothetical protein